MPSQLIESLELELEQLNVILAAEEKWAKPYSSDPESHAKLLKLESKYERSMRDYFRGFKSRINNYINWSVYSTTVLKAFDLNAIVNDDGFEYEDRALLNIVVDLTAAGATIGFEAGENIHNTPIGGEKYTAVVQKFARTYSSRLVTNISATTLDRLQSSLQTSIQLGESTDEAAARIIKTVGSASRARTIARTESVRSYQSGIKIFGEQSGAVGKEWQASAGCEVCAPNDGEQIRIDESFKSGDTEPPAHPNCRCGLRLIYPNELDANPDLLDNGDE